MKQKFMIRVTLSKQSPRFWACWRSSHDDDDKRRSKALKIIVGVRGVESASLKGDEKDEIEVIGDVDPVILIELLRKNFGYASLLNSGPLEPKKPEEPKKLEEPKKPKEPKSETVIHHNSYQGQTTVPMIYSYDYQPHHIYHHYPPSESVGCFF